MELGVSDTCRFERGGGINCIQSTMSYPGSINFSNSNIKKYIFKISFEKIKKSNI